MVLGFILDITLHTTVWTIQKLYNSVHYVIYGPQKDILLIKLEEMERKINKIEHNNENCSFYWNTRSKYTHHNWVAISSNKLILESIQKNIVLKAIADYVEKNENQRILLIQVGDELNMTEI